MREQAAENAVFRSLPFREGIVEQVAHGNSTGIVNRS